MVAQTAKNTKPSIARRFKDEDVIAIMNRYYGNKSLIVAALDATPRQFDLWLRVKEDRQKALLAARDRLLDRCEEKMVELLNCGNPKIEFDTAKYVLQSIGRHRGWNGDSPAMQVAIQKSGDDIKVAVQTLFGIEQ